jgi:transposase-like protein
MNVFSGERLLNKLSGFCEALQPVVVHQVKYLNNIVEQDHRAVKRMTKPMLGFKSFQSAKNILAGIELMHMIHKGQMMMEGAEQMSFAEQFHALAE